MSYKVTDTIIVDNARNLGSIGVATFANPVFVGSGSSTGTPLQLLQVTGTNGAYVGGNLGIGSTNPSSKLSVQGDAFVSGIVTGSVIVAAKDPGTGIATDSTESIFGNGWRVSAPASTTYYRLATLPAGGGGNTFDHLIINGTLGGWLSNQQTPFEIYFSNRNTFTSKYISYGNIRSDVRILGISTNSTVEIWAQHQASAFTKLVYNITNSLQVIPVTNPASTTTAPVGTTVFDSSTATPRFIINDSDNVGIGTTNPTETGLTVSNRVQILNDSSSNGRLILRAKPGNSYRWAIDNDSSNLFRIFREDDATSANGFVAVSISTTGTITANKFSGDGSLLTNLPVSSGTNYWLQTSAGISTLSNVGIGTTNPTAALTVSGNASITGILTVDQLYTSNNGNGTNVRIGDDLWIGDINVANTTRLSGAQNSDRAFIVFGSSDAVALGRTGTGPLYYGGNFTVAGVITASSFTGNASSATYATTAGVSTSVSGGTGSLTQLQVTGLSTFTNGPVLVGSATSTGTASQTLQVTGGAYVSGPVGLGTTNPNYALEVRGGIGATTLVVSGVSTFAGIATHTASLFGTQASFTGIVTANSFRGDGSQLTGITASSIGGITGITVRDEGSTVGTAASVTSLNFVGGNILATASGVGATITITDNLVGTALSITGIATVGFITATNLYVSGVGTFLSSGLQIRNPANTFSYTITGGAIAADRTLNLPVITGADTLAALNISQTFSGSNNTFSNTLTASGTLTLSGGATGTHVFGSNQSSATLTFGGTSGTGLITFGRSTSSQQTDIQAGASGVGTTKTINFGTGGLSGSFTQINIGPGPSAGVGTVVINSGTNLGIGSTTPTSTLDVVGNVRISSDLNVSGVSTFAGIATHTASLFGTQASFTGIVTANSFRGDGSQLTGISASGAITVRDEGSVVGTANSVTSLNFVGGNIVATASGVGATITITDNLVGTALSISGISTFGGISTFQASLFGTQASFTGVSTFAGIATHTASLFGTQASFTGVSTFAGIATHIASLFGTQASFTGVSTFSNTLNVVPTSTSIAGLFSGTTSSDMVRITQLGTGNALVVEDSTNPDSSPFVVGAGGSVGVGTTNSLQPLHVLGNFLVAAGTSTGQHITQKAYELNSGTLSWEGTAGQLFSITNNLTSGSIFSVNDVSGIPSIDVNADGTVTLAPYADGNVGIATTRPTSRLHVIGDVLITGFSTLGTGATVSGSIFSNQLSVTGVSTFAGITTNTSTLFANQLSASGISTFTGITTVSGSFFSNQASVSGVSTFAGIATHTASLFGTQASFTGVSTFSNGPVFIGAATSTGTSSQPLQVTGGAYISGNLGIGTTLATYPLDIYQSTNSQSVLRLLNPNTGSNASSELIASTGPTGNISAVFGMGGVNRSTYGPIGASKAFIYANGSGGIGIGADNASGVITFGTGSGSSERGRFTANGELLIGAATSTGTASQRLQVTGGAYVSGNIGAAVTSPSFAVDVSGDARVQSTGKMRFGGTAGTTNFYIQYNSTANSLDFVAG